MRGRHLWRDRLAGDTALALALQDGGGRTGRQRSRESREARVPRFGRDRERSARC
jgi:hypothetical protein